MGEAILVRPESHPEPRGFPVQWADPWVKPAIKSSDRPVRPRPRARVGTGRSDCSVFAPFHRPSVPTCKACYSMRVLPYLLTNARVCSLRPCDVARVSATLPLVERGVINTLLSHIGKGQSPLDAPHDHRMPRHAPVPAPLPPSSRSQPDPARRPRRPQVAPDCPTPSASLRAAPPLPAAPRAGRTSGPVGPPASQRSSPLGSARRHSRVRPAYRPRPLPARPPPPRRSRLSFVPQPLPLSPESLLAARRTLKGTARAASYHSRSPPSASTSPPSPTRGRGRRLSPPPGDASAMPSPAGISCPPPPLPARTPAPRARRRFRVSRGGGRDRGGGRGRVGRDPAGEARPSRRRPPPLT